MDLKGPSYVVDTACSSSLSALEVGYHYITSGKCEDAIIGTANLCLQSATNLQFFRIGIFIKFNLFCNILSIKIKNFLIHEK